MSSYPRVARKSPQTSSLCTWLGSAAWTARASSTPPDRKLPSETLKCILRIDSTEKRSLHEWRRVGAPRLLLGIRHRWLLRRPADLRNRGLGYREELLRGLGSPLLWLLFYTKKRVYCVVLIVTVYIRLCLWALVAVGYVQRYVIPRCRGWGQVPCLVSLRKDGEQASTCGLRSWEGLEMFMVLAFLPLLQRASEE
jgi:hypothetical protein